MRVDGVSFSLAGQAAWAPGLASPAEWAGWAGAPWRIEPGAEPKVAAMPAMRRRRAGPLARMALEVAYECLGERCDVPAALRDFYHLWSASEARFKLGTPTAHEVYLPHPELSVVLCSAQPLAAEPELKLTMLG